MVLYFKKYKKDVHLGFKLQINILYAYFKRKFHYLNLKKTLV